VRRYLRNGDWVAYQAPERQGALSGLDAWLAERLQQHRSKRALGLHRDDNVARADAFIEDAHAKMVGLTAPYL
jgi:hypothetical protein